EPCGAVETLARDAHTLIHEATFSERRASRFGAHSTAAQAGEVAARAGVRRLLLAHIDAGHHGELEALVEEARQHFSGGVLGDRHNGREWVGFDGLIAGWLRRTGWRLQSKGIWAETGSRERWDNRINYLLRFARAGRRVRPTAATLCWMLPLARTHPVSIWDATPEPVLRALILQSRRRGPVLDP